MSWLKEVIGTEKAVIAMCHLRALPGDPGFDTRKGMNWVIDRAHDDLMALQNGGVDAVMFSNEFSLPYLTKVRPETTAAMARIIGQLMSYPRNFHRRLRQRFWRLGYECRRNHSPSASHRRRPRENVV